MRTLRTLVAPVLSAILAFSASAAAQDRHAVPPSAIAQAVVEHVAEQDTARAQVLEALTRPEVQEVASRVGVDLAALQGAVGTLGGDALTRAAAQAVEVNQSLVGGASTITISTTTIIIGLLIIILILVID